MAERVNASTISIGIVVFLLSFSFNAVPRLLLM